MVLNDYTILLLNDIVIQSLPINQNKNKILYKDEERTATYYVSAGMSDADLDVGLPL
jgi:hypothetical protein